MRILFLSLTTVLDKSFCGGRGLIDPFEIQIDSVGLRWLRGGCVGIIHSHFGVRSVCLLDIEMFSGRVSFFSLFFLFFFFFFLLFLLSVELFAGLVARKIRANK